MNYNRIYSMLIDRSRYRDLPDVYEKHHIVPRCVGGSDDPTNIANLTPREHFIAHALLFKIYRHTEHIKPIAAALHCMNFLNNTGRRYASSIYHAARTSFIESISGENHYKYSDEEFSFKHVKSGKVVTGTRLLLRSLNLEPWQISHIINYPGESRNGWYLDGHKHVGSTDVLSFTNFKTNEVVTLTKRQMADKLGSEFSNISYIVNHPGHSHKGWVLTGYPPKMKSKPKIKCDDPTVYTFTHKNGSVFTGTRREFRTKYNIDASDTAAIIRGARRARGWSLI